MIVVCLSSVLCLPASEISAQNNDVVRLVESKRSELKEKEEALRREEERLNALRKEVDDKIASYSELLAKVETALKRVETVKGENIANVVKAYEVMPAEDAAVRLTALDEKTALLILTKMKSKKAGPIIAVMPPQKAASLTRSMTVLPVQKKAAKQK
jgi:flagellar motility protein MotE (MotC chaperone)